MEQTVTLQIFGRKYTFQAESGATNAKKIAEHFEDAVQKVESQFAGKPTKVDNETILVLTGLNITSEHFNLEEQHHQLLTRVTEKSAMVLNELEKAVP